MILENPIKEQSRSEQRRKETIEKIKYLRLGKRQCALPFVLDEYWFESLSEIEHWTIVAMTSMVSNLNLIL